jgi:hypothetical protein
MELKLISIVLQTPEAEMLLLKRKMLMVDGQVLMINEMKETKKKLMKNMNS